MFSGALAMLAIALLAVGSLYLVHRVTSVDSRPLVALPFLSGFRPAQHALSRYHARWYPATVVFLAFDIEMLFMYPWAVVVTMVGASAVTEMFLFLGVLLVPVLWAWREGAFRWV